MMSNFEERSQIPGKEEVLRVYREYFINREDRILKKPFDASIPHCKEMKIDGELENLLLDHVFGEKSACIGVYTPTPGESKTKWLCIDLDGMKDSKGQSLKDPFAALRDIIQTCAVLDIPHHIEKSKSGHGFHIWIFFDEPVAAKDARALGLYLAPKDMVLESGEPADPEKNKGIEIFPKNEFISETGIGMGVYLPWYSGSESGGSLFYELDEDDNLSLIKEPIHQFVTCSRKNFEALVIDVIGKNQNQQKKGQSINQIEKPEKNSADDNPNTEGNDSFSEIRGFLEDLDLNLVYGNYLTGRSSGSGWLQCRIPWSTSGDKNPSGAVADGNDGLSRGTFQDFHSGETMPVWDAMIKMGLVETKEEAFQKLSEWTGKPIPKQHKSSEEKVIEEFNGQYAVSTICGKTIVIREYSDPAGEEVIDFMSVSDFRNFNSNKFIQLKKGKDQNQSVNAADLWLKSSKRRTYDTIIFDPSVKDSRFYNFWRGFAVEPEPGDCSLYLDLLKNVICNGNDEHYRYLLAYMAHGVQKPSERPETAIVLKGGRGTGKGTAIHGYGSLFGPHYLHISNSKHLIGNFNAHLKNKIIVLADEAFWGGNKQGESTLKSLITEPYLLIEHKGKDAFPIRNLLRFFFASNEEWVIPAGTDERRFFVLEVSDEKKQDRVYFKAIKDQMENGGKEDLLLYLMNYDISDIDLRNIPQTDALLEQKIQSLEPVAQFWRDRLQEGHLLPDHDQWENNVVKESLYDYFIENVKKTGYAKGCIIGDFCKKMKTYCPAVTDKKMKAFVRTKNGDEEELRKNHFVFPSLEECRKLFDNYLGMKNKWQNVEIDDWFN